MGTATLGGLKARGGAIGFGRLRGGRIMSEAQATGQAEPSAKAQFIAAGERVEQKAKEFVDVLRDSTMKWASLGLGASRKTLAQGARALDCAVEKLSALENKLEKTPTTETPVEETATAQTAEAS